MRSSFGHRLAAGARKVNWPLVVLAIGFVVLVPLYRVWTGPLSWLAYRLDLAPFAGYEAAVRAAAVKTPEYEKHEAPLATIDLERPGVTVTAFKTHPPQSPLAGELWVSLPAELKAACAGLAEPTRGLQQILGLPPTSDPRLVYQLTVKTADIVRPCLSEASPTARSCPMDPPTEPVLPAADAVSVLAPDDLRKDYVALRQAYDQLRLVAVQMWDSYQIGFPENYPVRRGDYPYKGFPFTGTGRTYDWRPSSATHVGVTEFVVKKNAQVTVEGAVTPEAFCAAKK